MNDQVLFRMCELGDHGNCGTTSRTSDGNNIYHCSCNCHRLQVIPGGKTVKARKQQTRNGTTS